MEGRVSVEWEIDNTLEPDSSIFHCIETTLELPELSPLLTSRAFVNEEKKEGGVGV